MERKIKVAILSDSPFFPTGYSNQAKQLAMYLYKKGFEIHFFASGHTGATISDSTLADGTRLPFKIYGQRAPYFQDLMSQLLKENKIDFYIILLDTFMLWGGDGWFLKIDTSPAQTAFWFPSDGGAGLPKGCENILKKVEYPVAMAKFGQKQVKDYYGINAQYIPHGTEPKRYYRLPEEERQKLKAKWGLTGKFVIGTVMRNQGRKMPDKYIKSVFSLANKLRTNPEMKDWIVVMHTDFNDPAGPVYLPSLIQRYNLENRVISTGMSAMKGFGWDQMNDVYNLFDCFFLSTSGEGFGIPIIEAMSCEIPCVVTDYTTTEELIGHNNAGLPVQLVGAGSMSYFTNHSKVYDDAMVNGTMTGSWEVERGLIDINDAAQKILTIYQNPELAKLMGKNGRKAVEEQYDFETVVGPMWEKLILEAVKK